MPLCFDLDGTLGTFGSGYQLLRQALGELWPREPSREELRACAGSTDWELVDELHRKHFQRPLTNAGFAAYERACLARFRKAYAPEGERPVVFPGLVAGLVALAERGHPVLLVSGNIPSVLAFKAECLGIPAGIGQVGSVPRTDRTALLRRAVLGGPGPDLYVGDRPHDREAALACGVAFLGIGPHVEGLPVDASAADLVGAVEALVQVESPRG